MTPAPCTVSVSSRAEAPAPKSISATGLRENATADEARQPKITYLDYYKLNLPADEIAQMLNVSYQRQQLQLPQSEGPLAGLDQLTQRLQQNLLRIAMYNETARWEFLIAPILAQLLDYVDVRIRIEHSLYIERCVTLTLIWAAN